jgi:hypothetical protein
MNILSFASHQPYLAMLAHGSNHQFRLLPVPGARRFLQNWDPRCRPMPANLAMLPSGPLQQCLIELEQSGWIPDLVLAHNASDLVELSVLRVPSILLFHSSLSGRLAEEAAESPEPQRPESTGAAFAQAFAAAVAELIHRNGALAVFISASKQKDWGLPGLVIEHGLDPGLFAAWSGEIPSLLRVANHLMERGALLDYAFHRTASAGLPLLLLGENPRLRGQPAPSWTALKHHYASHRAYLHSASHPLEDGYNLAMLEAMATGMPILCKAHPSCPIEDGVQGFVHEDARVLLKRARQLLAEQETAQILGQRAAELVVRRFHFARFLAEWDQAFSRCLGNPIGPDSALSSPSVPLPGAGEAGR